MLRISNLRFDHCATAFFQHAPDSQRMSPGGRCKQAWNNPDLGYMDKVVFYRCDVSNCDTGWRLEPCRADNGNYWIANTVTNVSGSGWIMSNNGGDGIVSSLVTNVGYAVGDQHGVSSGLSIINSRFITGANTRFLLPRDAKVEGSTFELGSAAGTGGTLFPDEPQSHPYPAPSISMSHSIVGKGLSVGNTTLRASVFFNNRFADPLDAHLNVMGLAVNGTATVVLSAAPSDEAPRSALCAGPQW